MIIKVNGEMEVPSAQDDLVSSWPGIDISLDDAAADDDDYEQHDPPKELLLLPGEEQTPPEVRDLVLNSLNRAEIVSGSEDPSGPNDTPDDLRAIEIPQRSESSSQAIPESGGSNSSHSPSTSTLSFSMSTNSNTNTSEDVSRHGARKAGFSALLSSAATLFGSVKPATKGSSLTNKTAEPDALRNAKPSYEGPICQFTRILTQASSESECASCFEDLPTRKMVNLKCQHSYCPECFTTLITTAMQTESMFPPKCCLMDIPLKELLAALDRNQKELYKAKAAEYSLKPESRWYCPNAECGKWIPPSKLHRLRLLGSKCPSCDTRICGYCRGTAHEAGIDCPQDFGLEATLAEAERQGWRRCYKCRALVELTAGCRHITCKCNAQFCYTCGAKWRTCSCTEEHQQRRQEEIRARRTGRTTRSMEEEEEITRAVAAIEAQDREAEERERREASQRAIEAQERRRREHLERLEAEKRRVEEEEAARRRNQAIRTSIVERIAHLRGALLEIQQFQQSSLISRHNSEIAALHEEAQKHVAIAKSELDALLDKLASNSLLRENSLKSMHESAVAEMTSKHEAEEDDTFLSMQEHLRGKLNREARSKAILDRLQKRQKEDMDQIVEHHATKMKKLSENVAMEKHALQAGHTLLSSDHAVTLSHFMRRQQKAVAVERKWFEMISEKRRTAMQELQQQLSSSMPPIVPVVPSVQVSPTQPAEESSSSSAAAADKPPNRQTDSISSSIDILSDYPPRPHSIAGLAF
jgi:IBR domain, a half RING-finger domain